MKFLWSLFQKIATIILIVFIVLSGFHFEIKKEDNNLSVSPKLTNEAQATYRFTPSGGQLVTGTAQTIVSATAANDEGVNTGSWKGTLQDDDFHWSIASTSSGYDVQLIVGGIALNGANTLMFQTEFDLDATAPSTVVQICDWTSSTSVDNAADAQCTTGGWRTLNNQKAGITTTSATGYHWQIYDGYWSDGSNNTVSTPLTNFINGSDQIRIRYYSTTNTTSVVSIDYLKVYAVINSFYSAAAGVNLGSGAVTGEYTNTTVITQGASDNVRFEVAGTAGSTASLYFDFQNIKTYTGMNTILMRVEYSCSGTGINHRPLIFNYNLSQWEYLTANTIACSTTDTTGVFAKNNITVSDYINSGHIVIGWTGDTNSTISLRFDQVYIMLGSTNSDTNDCEISFGSNSSGTCANTRDIDTTGSNNTWDIATEDESNTFGHDFYAGDNDGDAVVEEAASSNIEVDVTLSDNMVPTGILYAGRIMAGSYGTVAMQIRYYANQYSQNSGSSWQYIPFAATSSLTYADTVSVGSFSWGGLTGSHYSAVHSIDSVNNKMGARLRTSSGPGTGVNAVNQWDFLMLSMQWIEDSSSHPSSLYQFFPTDGQLVTGTEQNILAATAASSEGVNTGSWKGTLFGDNFHWSIASTTSGYDAQLVMGDAQLNGANMLQLFTTFDLDATIPDTLIQICDWESTTSVDNAADAQCTGGGWRTVNNTKTPISTATPSSYTWYIYDGYWTDGSNGSISTPLTNFVNSSNDIRIRYYSTTNTTSVVSIDQAFVTAIINPIYTAAGFTNLGSGTVTGDYSATTTVTQGASDNVRLEVAGTAGSVSDSYFSFKNIKTFSEMNTIYVRTETSCSSAGINYRPKIYNFNTTSWEDLIATNIACGTGDNTRLQVINNITISDYISDGEMRVGWYGLSNSTISLRFDQMYIIVGATNTDSNDCEISFGTLSAGDCTNTRDFLQSATNAWDIATEDESNTFGHDYYALDHDGDAVVEEAAASHVKIAVTLPPNTFMTNLYSAHAIKSGPAGIVTMTSRDSGGLLGNFGGFGTVGLSGGTTGIFVVDNIQSASYRGGLASNPDDFIDVVNNKIWFRLRTSTSGGTSNNSVNQWDFAMAAPQWTETRPSYTQAGYRLFNNTDSADVGSALATQDTSATLGTTGAAFRLRMLMHLNNDDLRTSQKNYKLQYVDKGSGTCAAPASGTPAVYTDVTGSTLIAFNDNASVSDGVALTVNANDPTHNSHVIRHQTYQESNNFTNSERIINSGQDGLWDFSLKDNGAAEGATYCFRIVESDDTVLSTYSVYPEITTTAYSISLSLSDNVIGFDKLSVSASRWATGDNLGSGVETSAHDIDISTTAPEGYSAFVRGGTLTSRRQIIPNEISGLLLWLKPDSLQLSDNDPIDVWTDSSGNNNHATASGSERPLYKAGIIGGQSVARFDGIDDYLSLTSSISTVRTVIMVMKWTSGGNSWVPLLGHSTVYDFHGASPGDGDYFSSLYTSSSVLNGSVFENGLYAQPISLTKDLTNFKVIELQTTGNVSFDNISKDRGLSGRVIKGDIAEVIVFDSVITSEQRVGIETYLSTKYDLQFVNGPYVIDPIDPFSTAPNPGTEQFGLHVDSSGEEGYAESRYGVTFFGTKLYSYGGTEEDEDRFALSEVASTDTYSCYYLANISSTTESGVYTTDLTYTVIGNF